jgi:hypothetical protein
MHNGNAGADKYDSDSMAAAARVPAERSATGCVLVVEVGYAPLWRAKVKYSVRIWRVNEESTK